MPPLSRESVEWVLRAVIDPEIGLNIIDLGLINDITVDDDRRVAITMTLTTPNCPMSHVLPEACTSAVQLMLAPAEVKVDLVWTPAWTPERISPAGRRQLGLAGASPR